MDIDMDSPFSPGSAYDLSDLFEPPSASPPSSSLPKIARNSKSRKSDRQKTWQNVLGRSDKNGHNGHSTSSKKAINTGLGKTMWNRGILVTIYVFRTQFQAACQHESGWWQIKDNWWCTQLSSWDGGQRKGLLTLRSIFNMNNLLFQFLKKVQKQDRIVEEVKLLLKPAYNDRKITKESYKEILKKTVPKVSTFYIVNVLYRIFFFLDLPQ